MKKQLLLLMLIIFSATTYATHIQGGEITYEHVSGLTYKIRLKIYTSCDQGVAWLPNTAGINLLSQSTSINANVIANMVLEDTISSNCPLGTTCTNPSSIYSGFKYKIYEAITVLPSAASDWVFFYTNCCRNSGIVNINSSASQSFSIYATLDNLNAVGGFNNSVQNLFSAPIVLDVNQTYTYSQSSVDADGDSLDFSFTSPLGGGTYANANSIWGPGYSIASPLGFNLCMIDSSNGQLTITPLSSGQYELTIKVNEYRDGILIGSTMKDINMIFMNGSGNLLPTLSGVNATNSFTTSINVCTASTLSFTVNATDGNAGDSVFVKMDTLNIPGATLTSNNAMQPTVTFNWTPTLADVRPQPYILTLKVNDNACPYNGEQSYAYLIYVNQCAVDSVWPGDANADYVVDNFDVLNIGLANGMIGAARPSANTNWQAAFCQNWLTVFASTINHKHADCNGDGIVNNTDVNAVTLNYGQFHLKGETLGAYKTAGLPDLIFDTTGIVLTPGANLQIPIKLGSSSAMMNNIYGIAGHVKVSNMISGPITISTPISWIGNAANTILFQKNIANEDVAFTIVRNDQTNVSGQGQIATLNLPISANALIGSQLTLHFTDLKFINNIGTEVSDYNVINDTLTIKGPSGFTNLNETIQFSLFPNPVNNEMVIDVKNSSNEIACQLMDLFGNILEEQTFVGNTQKINTTSLAKGMYIIRLKSNGEIVQQKFSKL